MQMCVILVSTRAGIAGLMKPALLMWYVEKPTFPSLNTTPPLSLLANTTLLDFRQIDLIFLVIL